MALLPCPECSREISTRAHTCPHCGCPVGETLVAEAQRSGAPLAEVRQLERMAATPVVKPAATALGRCPGCGSDDLRKASLVYEEGTQRVNTVSRTGGVGVIAGELAFASGTTTTSGSRQALLAERLKPPVAQEEDDKGALTIGVTALIGGIIATAWMFGFPGFLLGSLLGLVTFVSASAAGKFKDESAVQWNARELPKRRKKWARSVLCMRCGNVFDPAGDERTSTDAARKSTAAKRSRRA